MSMYISLCLLSVYVVVIVLFCLLVSPSFVSCDVVLSRLVEMLPVHFCMLPFMYFCDGEPVEMMEWFHLIWVGSLGCWQRLNVV